METQPPACARAGDESRAGLPGNLAIAMDQGAFSLAVEINGASKQFTSPPRTDRHLRQLAPALAQLALAQISVY